MYVPNTRRYNIFNWSLSRLISQDDTTMPQTKVLCACILNVWYMSVTVRIFKKLLLAINDQLRFTGMVSIPDDPDTCDTVISVNER